MQTTRSERSTTRCLLVVARPGGGAELRRLRELRPGHQLEVHVLAPAFVRARLRFQVSDVDDGMRAARRRLESWIEEIEDQTNVRGHGDVGDADPFVAIENALGNFAADEIVIVPSERRRHWAEKRLLEHAWTCFEVPVLRLEASYVLEPYRPPEGTLSA